MAKKTKENILWGIGLNDEQASLLGSILPSKHCARFWQCACLPTPADMESQKPLAILISCAGQQALEGMEKKQTQHLDILPKILLLDEKYSQEHLENALDSNAFDIMRPPFTAKALAAKLRQAEEIAAVHDDVLCMTKEILLEREILERKNSILEFLVNFLANTSESLDVGAIIQSSFAGLRMLLPVNSLHAALWRHRERDEAEVELFIAAEPQQVSFTTWRNTLLEQGKNFGLPEPVRVTAQQLILTEPDGKASLTSQASNNIFYLPLKIGGEHLGFLAASTDLCTNISRDQAMALNSAMRHLALTLQNAQRFQLALQYAEYDSLTGLYNRRFFEEQLKKEHSRNARYGHSLSLLFVDLDYFKRVNDSKGHSAGDQVLQQVAAILKNTLRATDICARYGGEEFVLLLPHTTPEAAAILAERLRSNVAMQDFPTDAGPVTMSISLGLASTNGRKSNTDIRSLLQNADSALYRAKNSGRNCVCVHEECAYTEQLEFIHA